MKPLKSYPALERFWKQVHKTSNCWFWIGSLTEPFGYGKVFWNGSYQKAHRVSWQIQNGMIPIGKCVLHTCDTPQCVKPDHLFLGTKKDNSQDCERKGRSVQRDNRGSRHGMAKVAEETVRQIRRLHAAGITCTAIAGKFGLSLPSISMMVNHRTWRHI